MTQIKSTRAFRTISEAADELDLQAHVLRFWESKFPQIQPMKRRGGRRFYRPEDIEFLRGIKILLRREKHPIKDVQKLIRIRGAQSVMDLGRSVEQAAKPKSVKDTNLVPRRIKSVAGKPVIVTAEPKPEPKAEPVREIPVSRDEEIVRRPGAVDGVVDIASRRPPSKPVTKPTPVEEGPRIKPEDRSNLEDALKRLKSLKSRWQDFT